MKESKPTYEELLSRIKYLEKENLQLKSLKDEIEKIKEQAEKNERELNEAQKLSQTGSWVFDPVSQQPVWSDEMFRIWGLNPDLGAPAYLDHKKYIHTDDWNTFDKAVSLAVEKGIPYDLVLRICRPDGEQRIINTICQPTVDESGNVVGLRGTILDITHRRTIEQKLKDSEKRLQSILDNSPSLIYMLDLEGKFIIANHKLEKVLKVKKENLIGKTRKKIMPKEIAESHWANDINVINKKSAIIFEESNLEHDGVHYYYSVKFPIFDSENKVVAVCGISSDVTERKRAELELLQAKEKAEEGDKLKTAFIQNMSHEIRTPLNAIMGFSSLLLANVNNHEKLERFANIIKIRSNDLLDIINDILDISKIESGSLSVSHDKCKLNELFSELEVMFGEQQNRTHTKHISLIFEIDNRLGSTSIITDNGKLKQILINLVSNALKFTEEGQVKCSCRLNDNKILFIVSDTGIGIPQDKLSYIFERFAQLDSLPHKNLSGTGLGLPIVKGLVHLLNGEVWVDSEVNKGSSFSFTIDYNISEPQAVSKNSKPDTINIAEEQKTILIVEDDFYNSEYIKEVLSGFNFNIICAGTARDAIKFATELPIDLILMDVRLPDLNGYEATKEILKSNPDIKIIAQTAYANFEEKDKALSMGCIDYISKPTKENSLIKIIQKNL